MAEDRFLIALNDSIDRLAQGQSIEDCVQAYPEYADQLRLYLALGQLPGRARVADAEVELARSRIRANMDAALENWDGSPNPPRFSPWIPLLILAVTIPLLLLIGSQLLPGEAEPDPTVETIEVTAELVPPVTVEISLTPTLTLTSTATLTATSTQTATTTATTTQTATTTATTTQTATTTATPTATATSSPAATETAPPTATTGDTTCAPAPPDGWITYRVRSGDTLSGLAAATDSTIEQIRAVNCLQNVRFIVVGQSLFLAMEPVVGNSVNEPASDGGSGSGSDSGSSGGGSGGNNDDDDDDDSDDDDD